MTRRDLYEFGPFTLDPQERRLLCNGDPVPVTPKAFDVLVALVEDAGRLVEKETLLTRIWPDSTVEENNLADNISRLRKALGEDEKGKFIETVPKRGYRFVAPITRKGSNPNPSVSNEAVAQPSRLRITPLIWLLVLASCLLLGLLFRARTGREAKVEQLEFKAGFYVTKWTEAELRKAIAHYQSALAIDPNSSSAYSGLASAWLLLSDSYVAPRVAMPQAQAAVGNALRLDKSNLQARVSKGTIQMQYEWNLAAAAVEFQNILKVDPGNTPARQLYGWCLMAMGRLPEAQNEMRRALEDDPASDFSHWELGLAHHFARQYDSAVDQHRRAIAIEPRSHWARMFLGWALIELGKFPEATTEIDQASRFDDNAQILASLAYAYAASGRREDAIQVVAGLRQKAGTRYVSPYDIAAVYAALDEKEQALYWLDKAYEDRSGWLALWLKIDQRFDRLRPEPRFQKMLQAAGHTP